MSSFSGAVPSAMRSLRASSSVSLSSRTFSTLPRRDPRFQPQSRLSTSSVGRASVRAFSLNPFSSGGQKPHVEEISPRPPADIGDSIRSPPSPNQPRSAAPPQTESTQAATDSLGQPIHPSSPTTLPDVPAPPARLPFMPQPGPSQSAADLASTANEAVGSTSVGDLAYLPLQIGDLKAMGLNGWLPTRTVQSALEYTHVLTGLPWWASIILLTAAVRLAILPVMLGTMRSSGNMALIAHQTKPLQAAMTKASRVKDYATVQALSKELRSLYKKHDASPFAGLKLPLISVPIFASFFIGIRKMCDLPVPQLTVGGIPGWCLDLTHADPTYILPILSAGATAAGMHLGMNGTPPKFLEVKQQAIAGVMKYAVLLSIPFIGGFSVPSFLPLIGGWVNPGFPAAVLLYWASSNSYATLQAIALRTPWVRARFRLPVLPTEETLGRPLLTDRQAMRQAWNETRESNEARALEYTKQARKEVDASKITNDPEDLLRRKQVRLEFERAKQEQDKIKRDAWMDASAKRLNPATPTPTPATPQTAAPADIAQAHGVKAGTGDGQGWQTVPASKAPVGRLAVKPKAAKADTRSAAEKELETMRARRRRAEELVAAAAAKTPSRKR